MLHNAYINVLTVIAHAQQLQSDIVYGQYRALETETTVP